MVEVFKSDVLNRDFANLIVNQIHSAFNDYQANFDLKDCDHILRVKSVGSIIESSDVIDLLLSLGCCAEVLEEIDVDNRMMNFEQTQ